MDYTVYLQRECQVILNKTLETIYNELKATKLIPVAPPEGAGVTEITWRQITGVGIAKIISDYGTDFPTVELYGSEKSAKVRHYGAAYRWNTFELEKAARANYPLNTKKEGLVRQAIETKVNAIAWLGDTDNNIQGFLNYPGITEYTLPDTKQSGVTSNKKQWVNKTPDEIAADINSMVTTIITTTKGKESPNTCIMPLAQMRRLTTNYVNDQKTMTILDLVQKSNPMITTWDWVPELDTAGANGTARVMIYDRSPDKLELHIPVPYRMHTPVQQSLGYTVPASTDIGGVTVYYPQSACYADGV